MHLSKIVRLFVCAAFAAALLPGTALASPSGGQGPVAKPPVVAHPDVAPPVPGNEPVAASRSAWSLDRLIGDNAGTNLVTFGSFRDGDMIVVEDPNGVTGHAGMFDSRYYATIYSYAVWSANVQPVNGVQREQCLKYRANDEAYGVRVVGGTTYRASARSWAARQIGKPYNIVGAKTDTSSFYCSKLAWAAWYYTMGVDLDGDGGYWVWPIDLVNSSRTVLFGYWS